MKKMILASMFLVASNVIWGAPLSFNCTPAQSDVVVSAVGTTALFNCPTSGIPTSQMSLFLTGSWQDNSSAGPAMSVLFTADSPYADTNCLATGATNGDGQTLATCTGWAWTWINPAHTQVVLPAFQVSVTGGAGSNPLPFNGSASVRYEIEAEVPEIESWLMGFCGAALVALAKLKRPA